MIRNWNDRVKPGHILYHLGDFAMGQRIHHYSFYERLNGRKILIRGNHDSNGTASFFDEVHDELTIKLDGITLWMAHVPVDNSLDRRDYVRPPAPPYYDIALCGHAHNAFVVKDNCVNVGVDNFSYRPISLQEIIDVLDVKLQAKFVRRNPIS